MIYTDQDIAEAERVRQLFMQSVFLNDEIVVIDCNGDASIDEIKGSAQCAINCLEEKIKSENDWLEVFTDLYNEGLTAGAKITIAGLKNQIAYLTETYLGGNV